MVAVVQLEPVAQSVSLELGLRFLSAPQTRLLNLELVSYQAAPRRLERVLVSTIKLWEGLRIAAL